MKLAAVADASRRVSETPGRRDKVGLLAALLARTPPDEIEIAAAFLSGAVRQDKLGLGWTSIQSAMPGAAAESASVELPEVNAVLDRIARAAGKGSADAKQRLLRELLSRLTAEEQRFLARLIVGELRQGALEGLLVEAVARAAGCPAAEVRRALMMAGDLPAVARAALDGGGTGLSAFAVQLFQPVLPMLAGSAEDVDQAMAELGAAAVPRSPSRRGCRPAPGPPLRRPRRSTPPAPRRRQERRSVPAGARLWAPRRPRARSP